MTPMPDWIDIGRVADIPRRGARCVKTPLGSIAIFRTMEDQIFALENRCAHKAGPLSEGIVHGAAVTCPLHNWVYDLNTGKAQGADEGEVKTYPINVIDGRMFMTLDGVAQAAE